MRSIALASVLLLACLNGQADPVKEWLSTPLVESGTLEREVGSFVVARTPPPVLPADAAAWDAAQATLREAFLEKVVYRGVPQSWRTGEVRVEWGGVLKPAPEYEIRKLRYEALPGLWIPALVYVPSNLAGKAPAVLNVNGHVGAPGKAIEYEQIRCINLAKRGLIAFHPEWFSFGELQGEGYSHNRLAYLDLVGTSGLSVFYLAMKRAVDVLESMPETDTARIAMTGLSGGGWQTILLSALDTRIAVSVPNAGHIGIGHRASRVSDIGDLEQIPIDMLKVGDYEHLTAMLAPRPALLIFNAKDECCFAAAHAVPAVYEPTVPWYGLYGKEDHLSYHVNEDPGTHNYDQDNREAFYRFLKKHLVPEAGWAETDLTVEGELYTPEELYMGIPPNNENFITLALRLLEQQPMAGIPAVDSAEAPIWRQAERLRLREVLAVPSATLFELQQAEDKVLGETAVSAYKARIGEAWTVPVVSLGMQAHTEQKVSLFVSDDGYATHTDDLQARLPVETRVYAADLSFLGQLRPAGNHYQFPMMLQATGERALGLQTAQMLALASWIKEKEQIERLEVYASGPNASMAVLAAAALEPGLVHVVQDEAPESLKSLLEKRVKYEELAPLFAFGLAPGFEINVLRALAESAD